MAAHSSILAWRIPWREEPGGPRIIGLQSLTQLKRLSMHAVQHESAISIHICPPSWASLLPSIDLFLLRYSLTYNVVTTPFASKASTIIKPVTKGGHRNSMKTCHRRQRSQSGHSLTGKLDFIPETVIWDCHAQSSQVLCKTQGTKEDQGQEPSVPVIWKPPSKSGLDIQSHFSWSFCGWAIDNGHCS